jgi:RNA polymerase sigma-70 factor (ECF subfamily)
MVQAIVWRTTGDRGSVDDLVQETFLRVFRGLPNFGARSKLSTWICTVACRVALDHQRSLVRRQRHFYRPEEEAHARANPEFQLMQREVTVMLREELDLLADRYRLPLTHVAIHELRYDTVSQLLGVPLGTVKGNVFYAKDMLRKRLQRRLHEGPSAWRS